MPVNIQEATDMDEVRALFREYEAAIEVDLCFQSFEEELATLPGKYATPAGTILIAHWNNALAGCVALRPYSQKVGEMKRLYVRPRFRGHGVAKALAERVIAYAVGAGYASICLDTLDTMEAARGLYASLGFEPTDAYYPNPLPGVHYLALDLSAKGEPQPY